jgi:transposase
MIAMFEVLGMTVVMSEDSQKTLHDHYRLLLGLSAPWEVTDVDLQLDKNKVEVRVEWPRGKSPQCPECGEGCEIHDHAPERRWRHLDTMQFETVIVSRTPRVRCSEHGVKTISVPWAEPHSRFTLLFEALVIEALKACRSHKQASDLLGLSYDQLQRILTRAVQRGLARREQKPILKVGIDEKAFRRGHGYSTLMTDLEQSRVLEVVENRDKQAANALFESLGDQAGHIQAAAMDMWPAYMNATALNAPEARIVHDRFHVSKHLNEAVDKIRKAESKELDAQGKDWLKGTKYLFLRATHNWNEDQKEMFDMVKELNLKVAKAWAAKEAFTQFWEFRCPGKARTFFNHWRRWVGRLKLQPLLKVSDMLKKHLNGLLSYAMYQISNAISEGYNSKIQSLISNARGYRNFENLRSAILFHCGKLDMSPLKTR